MKWVQAWLGQWWPVVAAWLAATGLLLLGERGPRMQYALVAAFGVTVFITLTRHVSRR